MITCLIARVIIIMLTYSMGFVRFVTLWAADVSAVRRPGGSGPSTAKRHGGEGFPGGGRRLEIYPGHTVTTDTLNDVGLRPVGPTVLDGDKHRRVSTFGYGKPAVHHVLRQPSDMSGHVLFN